MENSENRNEVNQSNVECSWEPEFKSVSLPREDSEGNPVPLDDELEEYIVEIDGLSYIKHPLINQPNHPNMNGMYNQLFQNRKLYVEECEENNDYYKIVTFVIEKPFRFDWFMNYEHKLTDEDYWESLGQIFTDTEFQSSKISLWLDKFESDRPKREFIMNSGDRKTFNKLPNKIKVWRGVSEKKYIEGLSWTTKKSVGKFFSKRFDYLNGEKILCSGYINKEDILMCSHYENLIVCNPKNITNLKIFE